MWRECINIVVVFSAAVGKLCMAISHLPSGVGLHLYIIYPASIAVWSLGFFF